MYNRLVSKQKSPDDLSIDELRQLLVEKRRKVRMSHLDRFRKTGRVVSLTRELGGSQTGNLHSDSLAEPLPGDQVSPKVRIKRTFDRFLLLIEILAVAGFFLILFSGVRVLRNLNSQYSQALIPPTLTPTPLIVPLILPSGHTPPNSPQGAQPNVAEIPAHLMPLYQSLALVPTPTPGPEQALQIQIPAIKVDAPIVQGDSWEQLKKGVAQHAGSVDPGQTGNLVLSAHNDIFGEIFRYLDQLEQGDEIIVYSANHVFTYVVDKVSIVAPTDVEVMGPTADPKVTLISCYPYMVDNKRIVVQGSLQTKGN